MHQIFVLSSLVALHPSGLISQVHATYCLSYSGDFILNCQNILKKLHQDQRNHVRQPRNIHLNIFKKEPNAKFLNQTQSTQTPTPGKPSPQATLFGPAK